MQLAAMTKFFFAQPRSLDPALTAALFRLMIRARARLQDRACSRILRVWQQADVDVCTTRREPGVLAQERLSGRPASG